MANANASGFAALDAMIANARRVPKLVLEAAPDVAKEVERIIDENIARGVAPDGSPWQATKAGGRALVHAAKAVTARAIGSVVLVTVTGPEARHHKGTARGRVRRQIIPTRSLPASMTDAIRTVFSKRFAALMGPR